MYNPAAKGRLLNIPEAIAREEGWNEGETARCFRNNNPGNLNFEAWQVLEFGASMESVPAGEKARFARFRDAETGFKALVHLCGFPKYAGKSLANLVSTWAPPDENETGAYLRNIEQWTGLTAETVIDAHLAPLE